MDLLLMTYTPEPMSNSLPIPLQWARIPTYAYAVPSYAYPQEYGPPGSQGPSRLFAAANNDSARPSNVPQQPDKPPPSPPGPSVSRPPLPLQRWAPPHYPPPPGPLEPPAPWVLDADNLGPWVTLKPNIVKEPDNFNGDSNDITWFFSQCNMYFLIFNQHFHYHPHKVIFCASCFGKDAQV